MSQGIIYLIINKQNGHKYVGQTTQSMNKRWQQHIREAKQMSDKPLHCAIRKYGADNFMIKEIDECEENLLDQREEYWIKQYNTFESVEGYNATSGGSRVIFNNETKQKLSESAYNRERTEDEIDKMKTALTKKAKNEPWGFLIANNRGNGKHCGIKIQGFNIETGETKVWDNASDAAEEVAGNRNKNSNILQSARKGYKCYGYRWKLLEQKNKKKAVKAIDKINWNEYYFESIADAVRKVSGADIKSSGINKSLRSNGRYTWKGFMWFYL